MASAAFPATAAGPASVSCPSCHLPLPGNLCNTAEDIRCPGCDRRIHAEAFPALFRPRAEGRKAETILEAGVSSCFYHEGKKAVVPCDGCGRFLCALCDLELNGQHVCPTCLEKSRTAPGPVKVNLEATRTVYDSAAMSLAVWPLLIWPATILTAPAAIACAIYSFFRPPSLVGPSRWRAIVAILIGLTQLGFWTWGLFFSQ